MKIYFILFIRIRFISFLVTHAFARIFFTKTNSWVFVAGDNWYLGQFLLPYVLIEHATSHRHVARDTYRVHVRFNKATDRYMCVRCTEISTTLFKLSSIQRCSKLNGFIFYFTNNVYRILKQYVNFTIAV